MRRVYPTMITPYNADMSIDFGAVQTLVDFYHEAGCDGIFVVCQSSEMFHLTLRERTTLAAGVVKAAGNRLHVIASGHTASAPEEQAYELQALADTGIKALVLVNNRMAEQQDADVVWIERTQRLIDQLPPELPLGLYECPSPYKRLLSDEILHWCVETHRFSFIKDTCCDIDTIKQRIEILKGSGIGLYNANSSTLLASLQAGAAGFSGVMANIHPDLYVWLCHHFDQQPQQAAQLQALLSYMSLIEMNYPICAKHYLSEHGIPMTWLSRTQNAGGYGKTAQEITRQLPLIEYTARQLIDQVTTKTSEVSM
jgi:4-hydroxy-tetrahydrodipicolinate synthase